MKDTKVSDIVDCMKDAYKSIDLRIAAGKENDNWHNGLTVIRFSYLSVKDIQNRFKELESRIGEVKINGFFISHHVIPFENFDELQSQLQQGTIKLENDEVDFGRSIDLLSLQDRFPTLHPYTIKSEEWPFLEVFNGDHSKIFGRENLEKEIRTLGFANVYDPINVLLEIGFGGGVTFDVVVHAPFYGVIQNVDFEGQTAKIKVKFHERAGDLILHVLLRGKNHYETIKAKHSFGIEKSEIRGLNKGFKLGEKEVELPNATVNDFLFVNLAHKELGEICDFSKSVEDFVKRKKPSVTPMFSTFSRFCNEEEFKKHLVQPHKVNKPQKIFERAISWLLSLSGLCSIKLDEYEKLREKETAVERGSVDILADYKIKDQLFLVNCTIGVPKVEDIDRLNSIRRWLYEELFEDTKLRITPIIFSAERELKQMKEKGDSSGVRIFDSEDIENILTNVKNGRTDFIADMLEGEL
ncbi:MAG: hypothetical protein KAU16_08475 [Methanophagales archaeon]|nr:hypothetical protein [Methanophagales archaeon]